MFRKSETARCGRTEGPGNCRRMSKLRLIGLGHSEVVDILNFDSFGNLKSCGGGCMVVRLTH